MYLFVRSGRITGGPLADAMTWAAGFPERIKNVAGIDVELWQAVFSPAVGTLAWTCSFDDLVAFEAAMDKLQADPGYLAESDRGFQFMAGGVDDALDSLVVAAGDVEARAEYVSVVSATCVQVAKGIEVGSEICQRVHQATGVPSSFWAAATGNYGSVAWMGGYANIGQLQEANAKMAADAEFAAFVDSAAGGVYAQEAGAATQTLYRRVI